MEQGARRSKRIVSRSSNNIPIGNAIDFEANEINNEIIPIILMKQKKVKIDIINWHNAMIDELESLNSHKEWKIVDRLPNIKIIKSKWVYSVKNDLNSKVKRCKVRLVAAGFN